MASYSRDGEPLSPAATLFNSSHLNCYVIAVLDFKTNINHQVIREGLCQTFLEHPRFTSIPVKKGRKTRWTQTKVDIDNHIIVPTIDSKQDFPDRFVEDYISNITKTPLDISKPLWEFHILNIKTSNAKSVGIFRMHHSLGDGTSLISFLIAITRKTSDPNALPTMPSTTRKRVVNSISNVHSCAIVVKFWLCILWWLSLIWNTIVDVLLLVSTILFIKDTQTPLKGAHGVEFNTKRFVYRMVSMDDIKLVKDEMKSTINDILVGLTQAGLTRYLNRQYGVEYADDGAAKQKKNSIPNNIRLRASIIVNIRPSSEIQDMAHMMAEKGKAKWGNQIGHIIFPFSTVLHEDPLEYVRQAKAAIERKKHSLEAIFSYAFAKLVLNLFGDKICSVMTRRFLFHTTMTFSNVPGPVEEISFYGYHVAYIAPSVYGLPHALTIHFQSYASHMTICLAVDPTVIPNPYLLCDDLEESFRLICENIVKKRHIAEII